MLTGRVLPSLDYRPVTIIETTASGTGTEKCATANSRVSNGDEGKGTQAKESQAASAAKFETTGTGIRPNIEKPRRVNHSKVPFVRDACTTDLGTTFED